jgi:uncharacterized protein Usg
MSKKIYIICTLFLILVSQIYCQCNPSSTDPCSDLQCCVCRQNPNPSTGAGYYQFDEDCLGGGLDCIGNTGCKLCYNPVPGGINDGNRSVCERFEGTNLCDNDTCCMDKQSPNPNTGNGYYEFSEDCLDGGLHCIENTGCRLCYNPVPGGSNIGDRPVCARFGGKEVCGNLECCLDRQDPNPSTGNGYYEFTEDCKDGGLHCIENTGCRLCYNPVPGGINVGNRPICARFAVNSICGNEVCCMDKQIANPNTGVGYLEYNQTCLSGGLHCVENTGCRLCYNPVQGGVNVGNRPICARFLSED